MSEQEHAKWLRECEAVGILEMCADAEDGECRLTSAQCRILLGLLGEPVEAKP